MSPQTGLAVVFKLSSELRFSKASSIVIVFSKLRSELKWKNHGHTYEWGMSHAWMRHVTFMNEASHVHVWRISHMCMSWFERTFEWGMPADPRLERKGLTTFARRNKAYFFFLLHILKLRLSPEIPTQYSENRIVARDHSNRMKSEDPENTDAVYWSSL